MHDLDSPSIKKLRGLFGRLVHLAGRAPALSQRGAARPNAVLGMCRGQARSRVADPEHPDLDTKVYWNIYFFNGGKFLTQ